MERRVVRCLERIPRLNDDERSSNAKYFYLQYIHLNFETPPFCDKMNGLSERFSYN